MKRPPRLRLLRPGCRTQVQASSAHPQGLSRLFRLAPVFIPVALCLSTGFSSATVVDQVGAAAFWAPGGGGYNISWAAIGGNDGLDLTSFPQFDLVGDASNAAFSYARTADYVFFRMRVDADTIGTTLGTSPAGSYAVLIDIITDPFPSGSVPPAVAPKSTTFTGVTGIDYAFVWDSVNTNDARHGLEMSIANEGGGGTSLWNVSSINDIDGEDGIKKANDINGNSRTTDGYVRTTDSVAGVNSPAFGTTTLIDFAVKWSYLETYTKLNPSQLWNVSVVDMHTSSDHTKFNADVFGSTLTSSISSASWSSVTWSVVPEPSTALAGLLLGAGVLLRRRRE